MAHWLALYTAKAALRNAGLDLKKIDRSRAGVVLGNTLAGEFSRSHNLRHCWPYVERAVGTAMGQTGLGLLDLDKLLDSIRFNYESMACEFPVRTLRANCGKMYLRAGDSFARHRESVLRRNTLTPIQQLRGSRTATRWRSSKAGGSTHWHSAFPQSRSIPTCRRSQRIPLLATCPTRSPAGFADTSILAAVGIR
jgi:hypothetical protein